MTGAQGLFLFPFAVLLIPADILASLYPSVRPRFFTVDHPVAVHHFFKMKFIKNCTKIAVNFRRKSSELLIDFRKVLDYNIYKTKSSEPRREECKI